jgi:hypothetical protein
MSITIKSNDIISWCEYTRFKMNHFFFRYTVDDTFLVISFVQQWKVRPISIMENCLRPSIIVVARRRYLTTTVSKRLMTMRPNVNSLLSDLVRYISLHIVLRISFVKLQATGTIHILVGLYRTAVSIQLATTYIIAIRKYRAVIGRVLPPFDFYCKTL